MGFLDFIERQRKKSRASRQRIALLATIAIMALIITVWLTTLNLSLDGGKEKKMESITGPFSVMADNFREFGKIVKNSLRLIKNE